MSNSINSETLKDYLLKRGISPSYHRMRILGYMMTHYTHPTVDTIYRDLVKEIPTLSKTTVYNTLRLFVKKGIVSTIIIENDEVRYDIQTHPHAHFKCKRCGKVFDIEGGDFVHDFSIINGHKVEEIHVYFLGVCKDCLNEN